MRLFTKAVLVAALILPQATSPGLAKSPSIGRQLGSGIASYYGSNFAGRRTANGEQYRAGTFTAAHRTVPFGRRVLVTHAGNGRQVTVRINDRGPFIKGRIIDLSYAAAQKIGLHHTGTAQVRLTLLGE